MSRNLTATQVIDLGDYLDKDFEPERLTIAQLLGILGHHGIPFPTKYNKTMLLGLFRDNISVKCSELKRQEQQRKQSQPSDFGIVDGLTGEPVGKFEGKKKNRKYVDCRALIS
jgi:HeH/LEM domain